MLAEVTSCLVCSRIYFTKWTKKKVLHSTENKYIRRTLCCFAFYFMFQTLFHCLHWCTRKALMYLYIPQSCKLNGLKLTWNVCIIIWLGSSIMALMNAKLICTMCFTPLNIRYSQKPKNHSTEYLKYTQTHHIHK